MELLRALAAVCVLMLAGCGGDSNAPPDLPQSAAPSWTRASLTKDGNKDGAGCWDARYAGAGAADVTVCRFNTDAVALDAVQKARPGANTVHFQEGANFVTVKWTDATQTNITALVRAIQKTLNNHS